MYKLLFCLKLKAAYLAGGGAGLEHDVLLLAAPLHQRQPVGLLLHEDLAQQHIQV